MLRSLLCPVCCVLQAQQAGTTVAGFFAEHRPNDSQAKLKSLEEDLEALIQDLDVAVATRDLALARSLLSAGHDALTILDRDASILSLEVCSLVHILASSYALSHFAPFHLCSSVHMLSRKTGS